MSVALTTHGKPKHIFYSSHSNLRYINTHTSLQTFFFTSPDEMRWERRGSETDFILLIYTSSVRAVNAGLLSEQRVVDTSGIVFLSTGQNQSIPLAEYYTVKPP